MLYAFVPKILKEESKKHIAKPNKEFYWNIILHDLNK